ncbi:Phosphatidylinositol-4-phosphate 5-Kinase [Musa troglodytarum]|uniref:Phosphatidylinositol 3-phosphate 5-kinase type III n=1 Tax=Musa troglodytarum TaxID=320322 RepID=A0A9E7H543_9LILI|nr:Phosphatidylinositol-4-phosphate 5-Kinase [Musa troglodytarum]URE23912.1 Phosphatidylinositol-4-phosphate 5-Kinase [Musa troglodytarum]
METPDERFPDLVSIVKSWIPWRADPACISRAFWMPDDSCMVCYECDSQFTILNRRHHCRKCGRVFCAKCTSNFVPANFYDTENFREGELIRVCSFCFKQWEDVAASRDEAQPSGPILSPSLSTTSLASTKSSGTANSSTSSAVSFTYSSGAYQQASHGPARSPSQSIQSEIYSDKQDMLITETTMNSLADKGDHSPAHFRFLNRSDDDDDDYYGACHWDSEEQKFRNSDEFYGPAGFDESEQSVDQGKNKSLWTLRTISNFGFLLSLKMKKMREAVLFDDDEEDATGEWHYPCSSNSFGLWSQLLQVENISICEEDGKENWLDIITSLSWEAATLLKPDTSSGGGMDPGLYVKVKCLACGHRSDSMVVKGVVCKKNVAHRRMLSKIEKPRFLILGGALEYQRVTNLLSSFDTLLQQEMDHLKMAVAKIDAHHPNVLLVEKSCWTGRKETPKDIDVFPGMSKALGCTILLKGSNGDELKKVKHVVQYGVFAAYHLALETSFLADEGASLPELLLKSPITVALPDKPSTINRSISTVPGYTISTSENPQPSNAAQISSKSDSNKELGNFGKSGLVASPFCSENHSFQAFKFLSTSVTASVDMHDLPVDKNIEINRTDGQQSLGTSDQDNSRNDHIFPKEEFPPSPSDHQSILVSLSSRCVRKGTSYRCHSCEMPSEAHIYCYTHLQGSLTISVRKLQEFLLPGERDGKIWMWHRCLCCPRVNGLPPATRRVVMSDAAWGLSFGKFLELSFSNHAAESS